MPGDTFNMDPNTLQAASVAAKAVADYTGKAKSEMAELDSIAANVVRSFASSAESARNLNLDPSLMDDMKSVRDNTLKQINSLRTIIRATSDLGANERKRSREMGTQRKMLQEMRSISKSLADGAARRGQIEQAAAQKQSERDAEDKQKKAAQEKSERYLARQGREMNDILAKQAGLSGIIVKHDKGMEFSLAGVLALAFELVNKGFEMRGYATQTAAQFRSFRGPTEASAAAIDTASTAAWDLKNRFLLSAEAAGQMTSSLAQAGFEEKDMGGLVDSRIHGEKEYLSTASKLLGVQHAQGRAVESQVANIMNLRNNFANFVDSAQRLDALMGDVGRRIDGLSAEQAVKDIQEMAQGMRVYNMNILDSITLYHSLNRDAEEYRKKVSEAKEVSKSTGKPYQAPANTSHWGGLVTLQQGVQREAMGFITSGLANIETGIQQAIGKDKPGASLDNAIVTYQTMLKSAEGRVTAFADLQKFIKDKVSEQPTEDTKFEASVALWTQIGGVSKDLAIAFTNMTSMDLPGLLKDLAASKKQLALEASTPQMISDLLATGNQIARDLTSIEASMRSMIEKYVTGPLMAIATGIESLIHGFSIVYKNFAGAFGTAQEREQIMQDLFSGSSDKRDVALKSMQQKGIPENVSKAIIEDIESTSEDAAEKRRKDVIRDPNSGFVARFVARSPLKFLGAMGTEEENAQYEKLVSDPKEMLMRLKKLQARLEVNPTKEDSYTIAAIESFLRANEKAGKAGANREMRAVSKATAQEDAGLIRPPDGGSSSTFKDPPADAPGGTF